MLRHPQNRYGNRKINRVFRFGIANATLLTDTLELCSLDFSAKVYSVCKLSQHTKNASQIPAPVSHRPQYLHNLNSLRNIHTVCLGLASPDAGLVGIWLRYHLIRPERVLSFHRTYSFRSPFGDLGFTGLNY